MIQPTGHLVALNKLGVIEIKNTNTGLILLLSSAIIYGSALISASIYSHTLISTDGQGWNSQLGVFGTALKEVGIIPIIIAILIAIAGIIFVVKSKKD
jgi:hypothetical protein